MHSIRNYDAFTGLEAAIVLVAFVIVASVFSFAVLGVGFFTTQKSQEVVYNGVEGASSSLQLTGDVYGVGITGVEIEMVNFSVSLASGSFPIDFEKVVITYSNATQMETLHPVTGIRSTSTTGRTWAILSAPSETGNSNNLLEKGEQFMISVHPSWGIPKNSDLSIVIKPSVGATMEIKRSAPSAVNTVNLLY